MKKQSIIVALFLVILATSALAVCDYYVGDTATLPQVTSAKTIQTDPSTGHMMYLWGTYKVGNATGLLTQLTATTYPTPAVSYTFNTVEPVRYTAVVTYAQLDWNIVTHQWVTTASGVDVQFDRTYTVCAIPAPDTNFLTALLTSIKQAICSVFPQFGFCPA